MHHQTAWLPAVKCRSDEESEIDVCSIVPYHAHTGDGRESHLLHRPRMHRQTAWPILMNSHRPEESWSDLHSVVPNHACTVGAIGWHFRRRRWLHRQIVDSFPTDHCSPEELARRVSWWSKLRDSSTLSLKNVMDSEVNRVIANRNGKLRGA